MGSKQHQIRTKNCDHLIIARDELGLTNIQLSRLLKVSDGTVSGWLGKGDAPGWTELAIQAIRKSSQRKYPPVVYIAVTSDPQKIPIIETLLKALEVKFERMEE